MRLVFLDLTPWDYNPQTPYERPLGGMHSAFCYLAEHLALRGHAVTLANRTERPGVSRGVTCVGVNLDGRQIVAAIHAAEPDILIVLGGAQIAAHLRGITSDLPPMVLWTGHAADQPASLPLAKEECRDAWEGFAFCGSWQQAQFTHVFSLPPERTHLMPYGIAPVFQTMAFDVNSWCDRLAQPVLVYTSTPFRGLNVLLDAFSAIRAQLPEATLRIYSSMGVYFVGTEADQFAALYERARAIPGIEYIGSLPQPQLARALADSTMLAYPNTFAETGCIAMAEAMAAGNLVVSTHLGALPETAAGFARLLPPAPESHAAVFAEAVVAELKRAQRDPEAAVTARRRQVAHFQSTWSWAQRAIEAEEVLRVVTLRGSRLPR